MNSFTKRFLAICALVVVGGYVGYSFLFPTYHIRYRLSLDVEVNGRVQTTTDVIEINYQILPDSLVFAGGPGGAFHGFMHGAAPTIDLGKLGLLFIINLRPEICAATNSGCNSSRHKGESLSTLPLVAFGFPAEGLPSSMANYLSQLKLKKGPIDVPIEILPMFVRFRDIGDPSTFEEVNPLNLSVTFGSEVRLLHAELELTSDPITPPPSIWPKWLTEGSGPLFQARPGEPTIDPGIYRNAFYGD